MFTLDDAGDEGLVAFLVQLLLKGPGHAVLALLLRGRLLDCLRDAGDGSQLFEVALELELDLRWCFRDGEVCRRSLGISPSLSSILA